MGWDGSRVKSVSVEGFTSNAHTTTINNIATTMTVLLMEFNAPKTESWGTKAVQKSNSRTGTMNPKLRHPLEREAQNLHPPLPEVAGNL